MNEQEKKMLELYLKDVRKKRLFFIVITIFLIISIFLVVFCVKYKQTSKRVDNSIQEETESNIINENITNIETPFEPQNITTIEDTEVQKEKEQENKELNQDSKEEKIVESAQTSNKGKEKTKKVKPENKDFLFLDGYTMDNVTKAAQDYLKSCNASGECIPIKDSEGVYLGMRVIFY